MLTDQQFQYWTRQLGFSERTALVIGDLRKSQPSRRVRSTAANVSGRYPSQKMGGTIQFESHKLELAAIRQMETDVAVLEYYDQPPPIKLDYVGKTGRRTVHMHTPDFFVIRTDSAGWEEWKAEDDLLRLSNTSPNRYVCSRDACWSCPPGEAFGEQLGLYYKVRSSTEINWQYQRNVLFLEDYLRPNCPPVAEEVAELVRSVVSSEPGISLAELLRRIEGHADGD